MGAGACKDKVFVLDLNVVYLLSSLDSCASEPKVMGLTLPWGFNFLFFVTLKETPRKLTIRPI